MYFCRSSSEPFHFLKFKSNVAMWVISWNIFKIRGWACKISLVYNFGRLIWLIMCMPQAAYIKKSLFVFSIYSPLQLCTLTKNDKINSPLTASEGLASWASASTLTTICMFRAKATTCSFSWPILNKLTPEQNCMLLNQIDFKLKNSQLSMSAMNSSGESRKYLLKYCLGYASWCVLLKKPGVFMRVIMYPFSASKTSSFVISSEAINAHASTQAHLSLSV